MSRTLLSIVFALGAVGCSSVSEAPDIGPLHEPAAEPVRSPEHPEAPTVAPPLPDNSDVLTAARSGALSRAQAEALARQPRGSVDGALGRLALALLMRRAGEREDALRQFEVCLVDEGTVVLPDGRTVARVADELLLSERDVRIGDAAPQIEGPNADGELLRLSDRRGQVVLVHFWGFW